jgi:ESCRT-I complex subunit TSG101
MSGQVNLESLLRTVDCYRNVTRVRNDVLMCTTQVGRHTRSYAPLVTAFLVLRAPSPPCLPQMRNLVPKVEKLMHNNGMESRLLVLGGTVPMVYAGAQYNIPVEIYISEPYPDAPPRCYVRPTREMELKMGHRHVDREVGVHTCVVQICIPPNGGLPLSLLRASVALESTGGGEGGGLTSLDGWQGLVYLPYLHEWNARTHNLLELCGAMSSVFSQDPPVFSTKGRPPAVSRLGMA